MEEWITLGGVVQRVEVAGRQVADLVIVAILPAVEVCDHEPDEIPEGAVEMIFYFVLSAT